jgi:3-oxo-Delta1-steroid hydratase/dehydrogenase large subunit
VLTGADVGAWSEPMPGAPPGWSGHCLAVDKIRFMGEPIAVIAATSRYIAEDACDLIQVEYEPLTPVTDPAAAAAAESPLLYEHRGTNVVFHRDFVFGDVDEAFTRADLVVRDTFRWHRASANAMETAGCIAQWNRVEESLTAWGGFQGTGLYVPSVSKALRIAPNRVRLVPLPHGGSFGSKIFPHIVILMALLSRKAGGLPVKWIEDRVEHLKGSFSHGPDRRYEAELAMSAAGEMLGFRIRALEDIGAHVVSSAMGMSLRPLSCFTGPYRLQNVQYNVTVVVTNKCPEGSYRGWGVPPHNLALEHCLDLASRELGIDPAEIRRRNLLLPEQLPYEAPNGAMYDSGDYAHSLDLALELAGYDGLRKEQARARAEGRLVGIGVYTGTEMGAMSTSIFMLIGADAPYGLSRPESTRIRIDADANITAEVTFPWEGQGQHTFVASLLADYFGVQREDVQVYAVDSLTAGPGTGPVGSRQGVVLTGAVLGAAERIAEKLRQMAAVMLEVHPDDTELFDGQLRVKGAPSRALAVKQVAWTLLNRCDLLPPGVDGNPEASYTYIAPGRAFPTPEGKGSFDVTAANAAHVAMVEIDPETGLVRILKYAIADDCGVRLNPPVVEGMVMGGLAQGVGATLLEEHVYDEQGMYLSSSFMDYLLPTICEVPDVASTYTETPSPFSPLGVKGAGEAAILSTPAVLMSAINDALVPLGVRCTTVPATPLRLWELMNGVQHSPESQTSSISIRE